jgi:tetratricopeptide (TPR) repeat protein
MSRTWCAILLMASLVASTAKCDELQPARPPGLDGLALIATPTAEPLHYFDSVATLRKLAADGKFDAAEPIADDLIAKYPYDGNIVFIGARVKRKLGKFEDAMSLYRKVVERMGPDVPLSARYWFAVSAASAGKTQEALDALDQLVMQEHYGHRPSLYDDELLKPLREQPRFADITGHIQSDAWTRDEGWRNDVDYLAAEVKRVNPDYHDKPLPSSFEKLRVELNANIPKMSDEQIFVGMSRMLASLNQGHTNLWPFVPARKIKFTALPLQFYVFPEGVFVVDAATGSEDLIGAQLVQIENTSALDALRRVRAIHAADSGMEVLWFGPGEISLAQELKGLGIITRTDEIPLKLRLASGKSVTRTLKTTAKGFPSTLPAPHIAQASLAFQNPGKLHWFAPMPDVRAMFVQVNQMLDEPEETLEAFGLRLRGALKKADIDNVILDLRNNNGGNTLTYGELLRTLIGFSVQDRHKIYVLIGRDVYSAAANFSTDLERLALPIFIGEPTAMTGNNYGDESEVTLPYSGIAAGLTDVRWQLSYPYDMRRAIVPQVPVHLTAAAYFAGSDPASDVAKKLCQRDANH